MINDNIDPIPFFNWSSPKRLHKAAITVDYNEPTFFCCVCEDALSHRIRRLKIRRFCFRSFYCRPFWCRHFCRRCFWIRPFCIWRCVPASTCTCVTTGRRPCSTGRRGILKRKKKILFIIYHFLKIYKPGGPDLSRRDLDRESRSRHWESQQSRKSWQLVLISIQS